MAMDHLSVRLLGPFELVWNGVSADTTSWQRRAATLFKMIATAPGRRRSRDDLIELLWPETSPEAGASNLRYTLHLLRRALGNREPSPILFQQGWVSLNPAYDWEIDVERLLDLGDRALDDVELLESAVLLMAGEPLPDDRYEDWAEPIRGKILATWRSLALRLAELQSTRGQVDEAVRWYERLLESDPLDEDVVQRLLALLIGRSRETEALRLYRAFEARLREDLDVAPMRETAGLVEEIEKRRSEQAPLPISRRDPSPWRAVNVTATYPLSAAGELIGREEELAAIVEAFPGAGTGTQGPRLVLLAAEAGMGKTRLLAEAAMHARDRGMVVLAGGSYEEEGRLPWGALHDALLDVVAACPDDLLQATFGDLLSPLGEIVPELRTRSVVQPPQSPVEGDAHRVRLFSGVSGVLARLSSERPLLLILDDLQWADDVTLQVVHFLLRQPGLERVLLLGAYRSEELRPDSLLVRLTGKVESAERVRFVDLNPWIEASMARFLEALAGAPCDPGLVADLHRRSSGNPFFAHQIFRLLAEQGRLQTAGGVWEPVPGTSPGLPSAVRETVARRLGLVEPAVRATLGTAAVLGREFSFAALEAVSDESEAALFVELDAATEAHLIVETADGYAFVHPLLWEVTYARVPKQQRRRLHARAGLALERLYGPSDGHAPELARHFLESEDGDRALRYSLLAGAGAENVVAYREAERHFRTAVTLAETLGDGERKAEALERLGGVLSVLDKQDEAADVLERAIQRYEELDDLASVARAAAQYGLAIWFLEHRVEEGLARVQAIVDTLERLAVGHDLARPLANLYCVVPRLLGLVGWYHEELTTAQRAVDWGLELGEPSIAAAGHLRRGSALIALDRRDDALDALADSIMFAEQAGDLFTLAAACHFTALVYLARGVLRSADQYAERAFAAAEQRGGLEQLSGIAGLASFIAEMVGEWDRAAAYSERFLTLQRSLRDGLSDPSPWRWLGRLALLRGDCEEADRLLDRADAGAQGPGHDYLRRLNAYHRAEQDLRQGRPERALRRLDEALQRPILHREATCLHLTRIRAYLDLGQFRDAEESIEAVLHHTEVEGSAPLRADALLTQGMVFLSRGRLDEAEVAVEKAHLLARDMPYPLAQARALSVLGQIEGRRGAIPRARACLHQALDIVRALGAHAEVERIDDLLRPIEHDT